MHTLTGRRRRRCRRQTRVAAALREGPTLQRQRTHALSVPATTFTPAQNKRQHASSRRGDSRSIRRVGVPTADRGITAPAHARMHAQADADAAADIKHEWRRCCVRDTTNRRQRTRPRRHSPWRKIKGNTLRRDGRTYSLAVLDRPPPTVAKLRSRTQTSTNTGRRKRRSQRQTCVAAIT